MHWSSLLLNAVYGMGMKLEPLEPCGFQCTSCGALINIGGQEKSKQRSFNLLDIQTIDSVNPVEDSTQ